MAELYRVAPNRPDEGNVGEVFRTGKPLINNAVDQARLLANAPGASSPAGRADVVMPEMTGPELAAAIRVRYPDLPIIYPSGTPRAHWTSGCGWNPTPFSWAAATGTRLLTPPPAAMSYVNSVRPYQSFASARPGNVKKYPPPYG